ncbi:MAG: EamA family transporter [Candidatus Woesearchaeota archaeon]|nr:EamA family transporter [Candidatus Woesearchaeota archaeon]
MNTGILYALLAMAAYGLSDVFAKAQIHRFSRSLILFMRGVLISMVLGSIVLLYPAPVPISPFLLFTVALGIAGFVPVYFYLSAVKKGNLSIVAPIAKSAVIITVLLSLLFLNERLNLIQAVLICVIILGVLLLSMNIRSLFTLRWKETHAGVLPALVAALLWGVAFFVWKFPVQAYGPLFCAFVTETGVAVGALPFLKKEDIPALRKMNWKLFGIVFACAMTTLLGTIGYMKAISMAPLSLVMPIVTATPVVSTLIAVTYFKERLSAVQWLGGILVVSGIALLFVM